MTFRSETANTCAVQLATDPTSPWKKTFISKTTHRSCATLCSIHCCHRDSMPRGRHLHLSQYMDKTRWNYLFLYISNLFPGSFPCKSSRESIHPFLWLPPGPPHLGITGCTCAHEVVEMPLLCFPTTWPHQFLPLSSQPLVLQQTGLPLKIGTEFPFILHFKSDPEIKKQNLFAF